MFKITKDDIKNRFTHHPPKEDQADRYVKIRETGKKWLI